MAGLLVAACAGGGGGGPSSGTAPRPAELPASIVESGDHIDLRLTRDERGVRVELDGSAAAVFARIPGVYADLGIEPEIIDAARRRYGSASVTGLRVGGEPMHELVRCGSQGAGPQALTRMRVTLTVVSSVEPLGPDFAQLLTRVTGTGSRIDGTSTGSVECVSTGRLEARIAGLTRLALAAEAVRR